MPTYCCSCKKKTDSDNIQIAQRGHRTFQTGDCKDCGKKKSMIVKKGTVIDGMGVVQAVDPVAEEIEK